MDVLSLEDAVLGEDAFRDRLCFVGEGVGDRSAANVDDIHHRAFFLELEVDATISAGDGAGNEEAGDL